MNRLYKFVLWMTSLGLHHCQMLRGSETSYADTIVRGINWFGYETEYKNLMCLWTHDIDWHLTTMKTVGFNFIRLPFSVEFVQENFLAN